MTSNYVNYIVKFPVKLINMHYSGTLLKKTTDIKLAKETLPKKLIVRKKVEVMNE